MAFVHHSVVRVRGFHGFQLPGAGGERQLKFSGRYTIDGESLAAKCRCIPFCGSMSSAGDVL